MIKNFAIEIIQRSIKRISENDRKEKKKIEKKTRDHVGEGRGRGGKGEAASSESARIDAR